MALKSYLSFNRLLIIGVFIGQIAGALYLLTPMELLNKEPLYNGDYPAFLYRCVVASKLHSKSGSLEGYDPFLKAGYIFSSVMGDGSRTMQILARAFPPAGQVFVIKWYVFAVFISVPMLLYLAAYNFAISESATAILITAGFILWWIPLFPYHMAIFGLANFVLASYLAFYIAALLYKLTTVEGRRPILLLSILVPLVVLIHIESLVLLLPSVAVCAIFAGKQKKMYLYLLFIFGLAILLNGFWLEPYLKDIMPRIFLSIFANPQLFNVDADPVAHLTELNVLKYLKTFFTGVSLPLALFAIAGFYKLKTDDDKIKFYLLLVSSLFFAFLNYFGSSISVTALLQPVRFKLSMLLYLLIPTAIGISHLYNKGMERYKTLKPIFLPVMLCLLCISTIAAIPLYRSKDDLNAKLNAEGRMLLEWIKKNTNTQGRILLESEDQSIHLGGVRYYGGHLPILLPHLTKREFISTTFPAQEFTGFSDGMLFSQDIRKFSLAELKKYFDLYNIQWIICWSEYALDALMAHPEDIVLVDRIDSFYIFTVRRQPSYYVRGSGEVDADYNTLRLTNIHSDGVIILKYHWVDGLYTTPARAIHRVDLYDDPYGFIAILDPPESLVVHYGH